MTRATALVYIRKSLVKPGVPDPASPDVQASACRQAVAALGLRIEEYKDAKGHLSGRSEDRPGWQALRARLADPDVAALIVYAWDRAARSVRVLLELAETCDKLGVRFISTSDNIDTRTAAGRFQLTILAGVGEYESSAASERRVSTIDHLRRHRGRHYGLAPFGTVRQPMNGELVLVPSARVQANGSDHDALLRLYHISVEHGLGVRALASRMNAEGWRYRDRHHQLRAWTGDDVRRALCSHYVYAGYVTVGRAYRDRIEVLPGSHAPILPAEMTGCVAHRLAATHKAGPRQHPPRLYPLTGLLYCACGARLVGGWVNGGRRYRHTVRCPAGLRFESDADALDELARARLAGLALPDDLAARLAEFENRPAGVDVLAPGPPPGALDRLHDLYVWGEISLDEYRDRREAMAQALQKAPELALPAWLPALAGVDLSDLELRDALRLIYQRVVLGQGGALSWEPKAWAADWADGVCGE